MSFLENLNWRYATKKFDNTKKVSDLDLQKIRDAIRMAPTSYGLQFFKIVEVTDMAIREKMKEASWGQTQLTDSDRVFVFVKRSDASNMIEKMFSSMSGGNADVRATALKAYEDMVRGSIESRSKEDLFDWSGRQAYIALGFALAACAELNIDSCPMEGFDPVAIKDILSLTDEFMPVAYLTVGYRDSSDESSSRPKWRFQEGEIIDRK